MVKMSGNMAVSVSFGFISSRSVSSGYGGEVLLVGNAANGWEFDGYMRFDEDVVVRMKVKY